MLSLGQLWVIFGTAFLALALEMIWFSALGFGSWISKEKPDSLETFSFKRVTFSLGGYLILASLIIFGLSVVDSWINFFIVSNGLVTIFLLSQSGRRQTLIKPLMAELGFVALLLLVLIYVIAHWPW